MIKIGDSKIGAVSYGGAPISKIYKGSDLVFQKNSGPSGLTVTQVGSTSIPRLSIYTNWDKDITIDINPADGVPTFVEVDGLTTMKMMFYNKPKITALDLSTLDTSEVTNMNSTFFQCTNLSSINLKGLKTSKVTTMVQTFSSCSALTELDLSSFDVSSVTNMARIFNKCTNLATLDLSSFSPANISSFPNMFDVCTSLTHIKCKQAFKDWCWTNQDTIALPTAMRSGGSGVWEIVG